LHPTAYSSHSSLLSALPAAGELGRYLACARLHESVIIIEVISQSQIYVPESVETERLILRSPLLSDALEVNAAIQETFEELHLWMDWAHHLPTVEETEENSRNAHDNFIARTDFPFRAYLKNTNEFVLSSGLHPKDWDVPKFEIGYWCRASMQGQGYVTEAVHALTLIGFEHLKANRMEIRCDSRNLRSRRVAELVGYRLEATLINDQRAPDGKLRDTLVYALLPSEYKK
jgi:RimJ/RimL family protein N-acetyltransferase